MIARPPPTKEGAVQSLAHGAKFPFDGNDEWWWFDGDGEKPPFPIAPKWSIAAARGIIANLQDRRDVKQKLSVDRIDEDVRLEIIQTIALIIETAPTWFEAQPLTPDDY